jgi:GT2 family glycosyltransferase
VSSVDVSIIVVTYNSARDIRTSLESALGQKGVTSEVIVVDNGSTDGTIDAVRSFGARLCLIEQGSNTGFTGGMNRGIETSTGRYVLALNPDCRLEPDFCAVLAKRLDRDATLGSASGRLLRGGGSALSASDVLDSVGIYFTASGRHFDRGSGEAAAGSYLTDEPVFGVTGAAGFYRRAALDAVRISTGWFDDDFFAYREDADLAWRLRHAGWGCLYVPAAVAVHRRSNLPHRRARMSTDVNYHSVKNRWLLRINNQTCSEFVRTAIPTTARDLVVIVGCLVRERSSLPAFAWLWQNRRRLLQKRSEVQALRVRSHSADRDAGDNRLR